MNLIYNWLFPAAWTAFAVYWFGSAQNQIWVKTRGPRQRPRGENEPTVRRETRHGLFSSPRSPLSWTLLPHSKTTFFTGAAILLAGLGFAVWTRLHLGAYWSAMVAVKEGHRLIQTGPYRLARHPIYSGILAGYLGTAVAVGQLRAFVGVALLVAIYYRKSQDEERLLSVGSAGEYPAYRNQVGALIPVSGPSQKIFWSAVGVVLI